MYGDIIMCCSLKYLSTLVFPCFFVGVRGLGPVVGVLNVFKVFLELGPEVVGRLAYVLHFAFLTADSIYEVVEFTREVLWIDDVIAQSAVWNR